MLWLQFYGEIQPLRCSRLQSKFQFNCNWKLDCKQKFEMQPVDSVRCNSLCAVESSMELQLEDYVKRCQVEIHCTGIPALRNHFRLPYLSYSSSNILSNSALHFPLCLFRSLGTLSTLHSTLCLCLLLLEPRNTLHSPQHFLPVLILARA